MSTRNYLVEFDYSFNFPIPPGRRKVVVRASSREKAVKKVLWFYHKLGYDKYVSNIGIRKINDRKAT